MIVLRSHFVDNDLGMKCLEHIFVQVELLRRIRDIVAQQTIHIVFHAGVQGSNLNGGIARRIVLHELFKEIFLFSRGLNRRFQFNSLRSHYQVKVRFRQGNIV